MKGWRSTYSSLGMLVAPAPLLGLASREQVRRGRGQDVGGPNRVEGRRSPYSSLGMTAPLLGLVSREQVRRGLGQDVEGSYRVKGWRSTYSSLGMTVVPAPLL